MYYTLVVDQEVEPTDPKPSSEPDVEDRKLSIFTFGRTANASESPASLPSSQDRPENRRAFCA